MGRTSGTPRIENFLRDYSTQYSNLYLGGVVQVIRGQQNAARAVAQFEGGQTSDDRHNGWRYFLEETQLTPGMDPERATQQRWRELDAREARAMHQLN